MKFCRLSLITLFIVNTVASTGQDQLDYAKAYEQNGDVRSAARIYVEVFESHPSNVAAFEGVVRTFDGLKQYLALLPLIEKHFQANPSRSTALVGAETCIKAGKPELAEEWWRRVIQLGNDSRSAWAAVAKQQSALFLTVKAIESYQKARSRSEEDDYALELSQLYATSGQTANAAEEILKVHSQEPELALTYGRLSALMTSDSASNIVGSVIMQSSDILGLPFIKQWYYRHTGQWDKAYKTTQEIDAEIAPHGVEMLRFADAARAEGAFDIAVTAYSSLIDSGKDRQISLTAAYGIAQTLDQKMRTVQTFDKADVQNVIGKYQSIISAYPEHPLSAEAMYRAAILIDDALGNTDDALDLLTHLINRWRGTTAAVDGALRLADLYFSLDQFDGALNALSIVDADKNPAHADRRDMARLKRADILLFENQRDSARRIYTSLASAPGSPAANDALEKLSILMLEQDDSVGVNGVIKGMQALARRKTQEASYIFVATANQAKDNEVKDRCRIEAARSFIKLGYEQQADSQLVAVLDRIPDTIYGDRALILAADLLESRGDIQGAIAALTSLLVQYPRSILAPTARERVRKLRGDA